MDEKKLEGEITPTTPASEPKETPIVKNEPIIEKLPDSIDYRTELELAKKKLGHAENTIEKLRKQKKEAAEEMPISEITEVDFDEKLKSAEERIKARVAQDLMSDIVDSAMERISSTPEERELIQFHYDNSVVKSGFRKSDIEADLRKAKLLANEKKILTENEELRHSLLAKNTVNNSAHGNNQDPLNPETEIKFNSPLEAVMAERAAKRAGLTVKDWLKKRNIIK